MIKKVITVFLCITMIAASVIPYKNTPIYAYENDASELEVESEIEEYSTTSDEDFDITTLEIESEVISKRTESTKTFRRVDGTYVLTMYNTPVHYLDGGNYIDINNTLEYEESSNSYTNKDNKYSIKLPKSLDDNKKIKITMEEYKIEWQISDIISTESTYQGEEKESNNIKELTNIEDEIIYKGIQDNVDLQYILEGNIIKENIILNEYIENYSLSFLYSLKNLTLTKNDDEEYVFINSIDEEIFSLGSLYMIDAEGKISNDVEIDLNNIKDNEYSLEIIPDDEFLKTAKYPIIIDPTIKESSTVISVEDTYLKHPLLGQDTNNYDNMQLYINNDIGLETKCIGYINFIVPTFLKDYEIINSYLVLKTYNTIGGDLYLSEMLNYEDIESMTWDDRPDTSEEIDSYSYITNDSLRTYKVDITNSVNKWNDLGLTNMPGFELSSSGEDLVFYSTEGTQIPMIEINYIDKTGIKDYWTYNTQDMSFGGTGYISDFTGEIYFLRNDINFETDLDSLNLNFGFSNTLATSSSANLGYGKGWNISYNLKSEYDANNSTYYIEDYTGNKVYYYSTTLDDRLTEDSINSYECKISDDGSKNLLVFHYITENGVENLHEKFLLTPNNRVYNFSLSSGYLEKISSLDNSKETIIQRNPSNCLLVEKIIDTAGNEISLEYPSGILTEATLKTNNNNNQYTLEKVNYSYSIFGELTNISYQTNYDENCILAYTNYEVNYSYTGFKLETVEVEYEMLSNKTIIEKLKYTYETNNEKVLKVETQNNNINTSTINYLRGTGYSKVTDQDGNFIKYNFDSYGHTINLIDQDGNTVFYKYRNIYEEEEIPYELNHSLISQSTSKQETYDSFTELEYRFDLGYEGFAQNGSICLSYEDQTLKTLGVGDVGGYIFKTITLDEGMYSFDADIKVTTKTDGIYISAIDSESKLVENLNTWETRSIIFYVEDDNTNVTIKLNNETNTIAYFDNIVINKIDTYENSNLATNPSFEDTIGNEWSESDSNAITYYNISGSGYEKILGIKAVGIEGSSDEITNISQEIDIEDLIDLDTYGGIIYVGGWGNTYFAPNIQSNNGESLIFDIKVEQYENNQVTNITTIPFNQSIDSWQYTYGMIEVDSETESIKISFEYQGTGKVLFDNLSIFYENNEVRYILDSENTDRIKKIQYSNESYYIFGYDTVSDTNYSSITDSYGNVTEVDYDGSQLNYIEKNNVKVSYSYNSYGDVTSVTTINENSNESFTTSLQYTSDYQYISQYTDEFSNSTLYNTDIETGLLRYIENAKNVKTQYEYYNNGLLNKVYIGDTYTSGETPYVEYLYNIANQLYQINLDTDYYYHISYDDYGRMDEVKVNSTQIMGYSYSNEDYELSQLKSQTYGNGNVVLFEYNDKGLIEYIKYSPDSVDLNQDGILDNEVDKYHYKYDEDGKLLYYEDLLEDKIEYYIYDESGSLITLSTNDNNEINYIYDESGNISSIDYNFINMESVTSYDYNSDTLNGSYAGTTYDSGDEYIRKIYYYEQNSLNRLDNIKVLNAATEIYELNYEYDGDTYRTKEITYYLSDSANTEIEYIYSFDELGNITHEKYSIDDETVIYKSYVYDDYNQLIEEHLRDYSYIETEYQNTNCSKYYSYDINGNIINISSYKYGEKNGEYTIPSFYENSSGTTPVKVYYNSTNETTDIYELNIGETPNVSISLYNLSSNAWISGLILVNETFTNLDTSTPGYYYSYYTAQYKLNVYTEFRIVYKVGDTSNGIQPIDEISYTYDDAWKDQLESYSVINDGISETSSITYDNQGNPTEITNFSYNDIKYNKANLTWEGRKLKTINIYDSSLEEVARIDYTYNDQGVRIKKIVENTNTKTKYEYMLNGINLIGENVSIYNNTTGEYENDYNIIYNYDYDGSLIGFTINDDSNIVDYLYIKNIQGDITHIIDTSGNILVEYIYDAYGNILEAEGNQTLASINSFRYRSYYYDNEISLYYLNSRYYNPEIGRFINADGLLGEIGNIQSTNMYAYCANNPVMLTDSTGYAPWWNWAISGAQLVGGIALCFVPGAQGIGVSLIIGGSLGLIANAASPAIGRAIGGASSMANGYGAISTGSSILGLGSPGLIGGIALIGVGTATMAFGANEIAGSITGNNYIQSWTGISDTAYGWTYIGLNIASSVGQVAGRAYNLHNTRVARFGYTGNLKGYHYFDQRGNILFDFDYPHGNVNYNHFHGWFGPGMTGRTGGHWSYIELIQWLLGGK